MQYLYRDDEVTFYIGFSLCSVLYIVRLGSCLSLSVFVFFPCRDIPRQSFRKRKKKRTDTLVLVITNYKQKHIIRGTTCEAFDCDSFQKTDCSQTWKKLTKNLISPIYKISKKVLEKSVELRRAELHDQWAKLLSGLTVSVFSITVSVPTSTLTKLLNGMLDSMTRSWVDNESMWKVHVTGLHSFLSRAFPWGKGKTLGARPRGIFGKATDGRSNLELVCFESHRSEKSFLSLLHVILLIP